MRRVGWITVLALGLAAAAAVTQTTLVIRRQSAREEARPADVILILGAAEYRGRPSPVLKARLDHGLQLYRRKLASRILTTGGAGGDPIFTEAAVARDYLRQQGVPAEAIIVEAEGESTLQSAVAAAEIMRRMGLRSCVVVSDGYHIFRAKKILAAQGLTVYGSPRPGGNVNSVRHWWLCLRQAAGYLLWSVGMGV
jgi:uncharacterized SAM-binding protein YcdF (DUF218 family)